MSPVELSHTVVEIVTDVVTEWEWTTCYMKIVFFYDEFNVELRTKIYFHLKMVPLVQVLNFVYLSLLFSLSFRFRKRLPRIVCFYISNNDCDEITNQICRDFSMLQQSYKLSSWAANNRLFECVSDEHKLRWFVTICLVKCGNEFI